MMQISSIFVLTVACFQGVGAVTLSANPVSKVVKLLEGLSAKIDNELDADTDLYESYKCWATKLAATKTASNEEAQSRVDSLKAYVADIDAGKVTVTSEGGDVEKEIDTLEKGLAASAATRKEDKATYDAATKENGQAIKAMGAAIKTLDDATKSAKPAKKSASMLSLRAHVQQTAMEGESQGFSSRVEESMELEHAIAVAQQWLKPGDAMFLQRVLSGEVPVKDWKKLNRKADFKTKYAARSVKIQDTLTKLNQDFVDTQADLDKDEKATADSYELLRSSKQGQLDKAKTAQSTAALENGARSVEKSDSNAEISALEDQIKADNKLMADAATSLATEKKEYVVRKGLRIGEIAAINKALAIISSDDAKDLFKRSIPGASASFLQVSSRIDDTATTSVAMASAGLHKAAHASGDKRLTAMAMRIELKSRSSSSLLSSKKLGAKFDDVIKSLNSMITELGTDKTDDEKKKKTCEDERKTNTKESGDTSREIDGLSDDVTKLQGEIAQKSKAIETEEKSIKDTTEELAAAKKMRDAEHAAFVRSDDDDTVAIELVKGATKVLKDHYAAAFAFVQVKEHQAPDTGDAVYGGAKTESKGIIGMLDTIKFDMETDKKDAKEAEGKKQDAYDELKKQGKASIKASNAAIGERESEMTTKEESVTTKSGDIDTKRSSLAAVIQTMKTNADSCDFLLTNYAKRVANRKLEVEGITKALKLLDDENKKEVSQFLEHEADLKLSKRGAAAKIAEAARLEVEKAHAALAKAKAELAHESSEAEFDNQ